jgi:hypothetical protein
MKQYRFKIDTPWGKKGESPKGWVHADCFVNDHLLKDPAKCPDVFEEIPDPVERVREWLLHVMPAKDLAEHLLAAGLDVEKLTGGE